MAEKFHQTVDDETIAGKFGHNWAFWLFNRIWFSRIRLPYVPVALLITMLIFLTGLLCSLVLGVVPTYVSNATLYLNLLGIVVALGAFGWFTQRLPNLLTKLVVVFDVCADGYLHSIGTWAAKIANNTWWFVLASLPFIVLNTIETFDYWNSSNPPILLVPWVQSRASIFFAIFYGALHSFLIPCILGSGIVGMVGVVVLLYHLFQHPIKLAYYRHTESVIQLTAWLLMWTLIGLASVLVLGRPYILFPAAIPSVKINALIESGIATCVVLGIGTLPLCIVGSAIERAKNKALKPLEVLNEKVTIELAASLSEDSVTRARELREKAVIIEEEMNRITKIPTLPIRWPAIARVSFGAILSACSPLIEGWFFRRP